MYRLPHTVEKTILNRVNPLGKQHGSFDSESGTFTAKTTGMYQFLIEWEDTNIGEININVNGHLCDIFSKDTHSFISFTKVLNIEYGDRVNLSVSKCFESKNNKDRCNRVSIQLSVFLLSNGMLYI